MTADLRAALDDAIYDAAILRTETVHINAPIARAIRAALVSTPEPAPVAEGLERCVEPVWDGPYRMECGRSIVGGECGRHGPRAALAAASPSPETE